MLIVQTRDSDGSIREWETFAEAFMYAQTHDTEKISWDDTRVVEFEGVAVSRVRLIRVDPESWIYQPLEFEMRDALAKVGPLPLELQGEG